MNENEPSVKSAEDQAAQTEALTGRLFQSLNGAYDLLTVAIGDRLGFYQALHDRGPCTPGDLAQATGTAERYVREWLEQQAVTGFLQVEDQRAEASTRKYRLPPHAAPVFIDNKSMNYALPFGPALVAMAGVVSELAAAFRSGKGLAYKKYGPDAAEIQSRLSYPMFVNLLANVWLPSIPDIHARLKAEPPAQVLDVACGAGWSTIIMGQAYPRAIVKGIDSDQRSMEMARKNLSESPASGNVSFEQYDAGRPIPGGPYDLITVFEAIHDMSQPVKALKQMRKALSPGGSLIVADERANEGFTAPGDDVHRLLYAVSVLMCLPNSMAKQPSMATGAVFRASTFRSYARQAGFKKEVEEPGLDSPYWRFYRLRP